ncbi:MAG: type I-U CRISPR-associated protein Csb2 [Gammaproteobacteria bacterium]
MLTLAFTFPAGRYHATPWDRHVNEGAVAWPPEPWRILRALIATWHHKIKETGKHTEATLLTLIESLTEELPEYCLPAASHSHTRHYMPQFAVDKTSLIFDAFTAVEKNQPLTVSWPNLTLPDEQTALLDDLLAVMGYLGRAESWVEATRIDEPHEPNCRPGNEALDTDTGELKGEAISLYTGLPKLEYEAIRERFLTDKKAIKKLGATLPDNLLDALSIDTADLRKQGWNQPPAAQKVTYLRPVDALRPKRMIPKAIAPSATTAQFLVIGKPLPRAEDSLRIGELLRQAVMSQAKRKFGADNIPAIFSGHGLAEDNRHSHAFYLPWDSNDSGYIDRLLLHVPASMDSEQRRVVEKLNRIWSRDGGEWRLVLESIGNENSSSLLTHSTKWQSITPYLHPWHCKKNYTVEDQIRRECRERGFPEPIKLERLESIRIKGRERKPIHFSRFRNKRGLAQPDRQGSFWRISFSEPVSGPLALGFGCHFGLGLFRPTENEVS